MSSLTAPGDILDRHLRVDSVLVVEVDGVDPEPLQRAVDDLPDDLGAARHPPSWLTLDGIDVPAEFGGDHHLTPVRRERLADEFLVGVRTVDLGGVEEGDAAVDGGAGSARSSPADRACRCSRRSCSCSPARSRTPPGRCVPRVRLSMVRAPVSG